MKPVRRPGIASIDSNIPQMIRDVLQPMKENIEIANGIRTSGRALGSGVGYDGWLRRSFTLGMAIKAGLISEAVARQLYDEP